MENPVNSTALSISWVRVLARIVSVCWAGFWGLFLVFDVIGGLKKPFRWDGVLFIAMGLIVVSVPTLLAWRRDTAGGIALVIAGLGIAAFGVLRPPGNLSGAGLVEALSLQALPPLIAGGLFLLSRRRAGAAGGS